MSNDLDSLLDLTLDDLEDLPEFKNFPAGAHRVLATLESKEVNGKPCVEISFTYVSCEELADPQEAEPKAGDKCSSLFFLDNEFGQGALKKCAEPFAQALGLINLREIVEQTTDVEAVLVSSIQVDKKDSTKQYLRIQEIAVV